MKYHLKKVQDLAGITMHNALEGEKIRVLTRVAITSDDEDFYLYIENMANDFFNNVKPSINPSTVYQFLILIHNDLSADLYVNDLPILIEVRVKQDVKKGQEVRRSDIADVSKLTFKGIEIKETDKIICCFKVGWKFAFFYDLDRRSKKLDMEEVSHTLGRIYRYLEYQKLYITIEKKEHFEEMIKDGWFPFIELIGSDYEDLIKYYGNKFNFENSINKFLDRFNKERVGLVTGKWWKKKVFNKNSKLLRAGIEAFLQNDEHGYINCINTLYPQIEGVLRLQYYDEYQKGNTTTKKYIEYLIKKGTVKSGSDDSLFFPGDFLTYLKDIVFADFDIEKNRVDISRHTTAHGVASEGQFTKEKALQALLILDQIYYYL